MVSKIKGQIQKKLNSICFDKYTEEVERQMDCYRQWYLHNEGWKNARYQKANSDIVIFADRDGIVEEKAAEVVAAFFREHPWVQIAYGDEDCLDENGRRCNPWFKPQWSPDTLDSFQYFGHFFAVRKELLAEMDPLQEKGGYASGTALRDGENCAADLGLQGREGHGDDLEVQGWEGCLTDCGSEDCHRLLLALTKKVTERRWIRASEEEKAIAPIGKVLIHMKKEKADAERKEKEFSLPAVFYTQACAAEISIIIPSKDNPEILRTCISSVREKTQLETASGARLSLEIIVVDNGSNNPNREKIEQMAQEFGFFYLYRPMPFNFSTMCNLGVERAKGDFLLFLNDDMEIIQPDWLLKLLEKACLSHAGAVGAKLLYPDRDLIQHAGITNIKAGPVHKLLKHHDKKSYYHGQNRHIYDMIGVTAACLLVERKKFEEAGRFFEGMAVSYNDVDFCFTLHELGYYNILRNDVTLYHHESLSRGDDNLSDEKWVRLLQEKDVLFDRHPSLKSFDPFYSRNLAVHSSLYYPNFMYEFEKRDYYTQVREWKGKEPSIWENGCLTVNVEHARKERKLEFTERDDVYWIEGWSYVLGMDNCRYQRELLLHGAEGKTYRTQVLSRYRDDVAAILPEQTNVELSGFVCRIPKRVLPKDTYTIAMLAKDRCSHQRLYQKTESQITFC